MDTDQQPGRIGHIEAEGIDTATGDQATGTLYETGYSMWTPLAFRDRVQDLNATVWDIRYRPYGKRGWRRPELAQLLGDSYEWVRGLGNVNYRGGPIELVEPGPALADLRGRLDNGENIILLCVCARYEDCHRKTICKRLGQEPTHL